MARGYQVTVGLIDGQGRETSHTLTLSTAITTIAGAQTALDAILADWPALSGLGVVSATLSVPMTVTVTTAEAHSNFDEGARIKLKSTDNKTISYRVPAPLRDSETGLFVYITEGEVDVSDGGITGYFANFLSAGAFRFGDVAQQVLAVSGILSGKLEKA